MSSLLEEKPVNCLSLEAVLKLRNLAVEKKYSAESIQALEVRAIGMLY